MFSLKTWRDSNPSSVPEADSMPTTQRRRGSRLFLCFVNCIPILACFSAIMWKIKNRLGIKGQELFSVTDMKYFSSIYTYIGF
jgi:hypothetical protein